MKAAAGEELDIVAHGDFARQNVRVILMEGVVAVEDDALDDAEAALKRLLGLAHHKKHWLNTISTASTIPR